MAAQRTRLGSYLRAGRFAAARHDRRNLLNAARFAATHPRGALVMARKGIARTLERDQRKARDVQAARAWIAENAQDRAALANAIAPQLWEEAGAFAEQLDARAKPILAEIPYKLHGGADHRFLYWLTRLTKPKVVVETGVCAGWTSQTFLAAMRANGVGELYSSDFPLFHIPDPESVIGCLVEDELRERWHLYVDSDEVNLPKIAAQVSSVDLFHYDSDKAYTGRSFAVDLIAPLIGPDGLLIMNDVRNDSWFYDRARQSEAETTIFLAQSSSARNERHYGLIGKIPRAETPPR
jgi:predicted O-methyltransferase YrrM